MRCIAGVIAACVAAVGAGPAAAAEPKGLGVKPFVLSTEAGAQKPNVAVDDMGVGHFLWDVDRPYPESDPARYCRVPRGASACQAEQSFSLPLEAFGEPQVLTPGPGQVILITSRCCGAGEGTYAIVSTDSGATFAAPRVVGTVRPGQAVYGPGTNAVSLVDDVVTAGISYQAAPLDGFTDAEANVGGGPGLKGYSGTIGFPDPTTPLVAYDDLDTAYFRLWSGSGDVNDLASWGPEQVIGPLTDLRIATGPKGVVLIGKEAIEPGSAFDRYTARRFDTSTNTFGEPVNVSNPAIEQDVIFRDVFQDPGGNVAATFVANGHYGKRIDPIRYRASIDGARTWLPERTLVASTDDGAFNLQMGAAADGGGFVAWDGNSDPPLMAVAIPTLAQSGGAGAGSSCVGQVSFGKVEAIATAGCLKKRADGSYVTGDPVRINGLDLVPQSTLRRGMARTAATGTITIDPVDKRIRMTGTNVKAGPVVLDKGTFDWDVSKGTGAITTFSHLEKFKVKIFGFPVAGQATLKFDDKGAIIPAHLELPSIFGGVTGDVTLRLANPDGLKLEGFKIHVGQAFLGALQIKPLDVEYKGSQPPIFEGSARFLLPPSYAQPGAKVSFGFENGKFKHAEGTMGFTPPLALSPPWAYLRQIGLALTTDPLKINGGLELIGGPQILGKSALTIDALPPQGFTFQFGDPAILRVEGSAKVVDIPFAHAFAEFRTSGLFKFGGGLDFTAPLGLASLTAGIPKGPPLGPGFIDLSNGRFNAPFAGNVCVPAGCGFIDIGAKGVLSSKGVAACGEYLISETPEVGVSAGFGYTWAGDADVFGAFGGCSVAGYVESVSGRQAGTYRIDVPAGLPQKNLVVLGDGGPPLVTVTGPDGETVSSGAGGAPAKSTRMAVYSTPAGNATTVLIGRPVAGAHTITTQPGSPPIVRLAHADGLPEPKVTAKVLGKGHARRLSYRVTPIAGQTVRFAERSAAAGADLGAAKGASGTLRFRPAGGPKGRRQIVALVDQNGVPRQAVVVATYVAPAPQRPGRPRFVRVRRSGGGVKVSWGKAARAARYVVRIRLREGTSKLFVVGGRKRSLKIAGVPSTTSGRITVAGLTATSSKAGPARKADVKRKAKKRKRRN